MSAMLRVKPVVEAKGAGCQETTEPLDSTEQDEIIKELVAEANRSANQLRNTFCVLFSLIAFLFTVVLIYSLKYPWQMSHQMVFTDTITAISTFNIYYLISVINFVGLAYYIKVSRSVE